MYFRKAHHIASRNACRGSASRLFRNEAICLDLHNRKDNLAVAGLTQPFLNYSKDRGKVIEYGTRIPRLPLEVAQQNHITMHIYIYIYIYICMYVCMTTHSLLKTKYGHSALGTTIRFVRVGFIYGNRRKWDGCWWDGVAAIETGPPCQSFRTGSNPVESRFLSSLLQCVTDP